MGFCFGVILSHGFLLWSASGTLGPCPTVLPHRASPRRVSLKMKMGRSTSTKNPSSHPCQRFPRDSLSFTPINLVLKMSKWYRILARYDYCLISCLTFFFLKKVIFNRFKHNSMIVKPARCPVGGGARTQAREFRPQTPQGSWREPENQLLRFALWPLCACALAHVYL